MTRAAGERSAPSPAPLQPSAVPMQAFRFGGGAGLFPQERPIIGSDIERMKVEAGYDLNTIEATLGISRRTTYYEITDDKGSEPVPEIAMAILMRLSERFPREVLPFQPPDWVGYLDLLGVHPGEFAQLVGREYRAGRTWRRGLKPQRGLKPHRSVQLILEAFARAGVMSTDHPVYQAFVEIAYKEAQLRGEKLGTKRVSSRRRNYRTAALIEAESSLLTPVDD